MNHDQENSLPQIESMVRNADGTYRTTILIPAAIDLGPKTVAITVDLPAEHADPLTRHEAGMLIMLKVAQETAKAAKDALTAYISASHP